MAVADRNPPGVIRVRAANPSALTLDGTNSYVMGHWVVDPGPADPAHLQAVRAAARERIEGVVLTHSHSDHAEGADELGASVTLPSDGQVVGPFRALGTPGHSADSVCLVAGRACFTGDTVLGTGSVFIAPGEGSLSAYLGSLRRLRALELDVIVRVGRKRDGLRDIGESTDITILCVTHEMGFARDFSHRVMMFDGGHVIEDAQGKLAEYIEHRLDRERRLVAALDSGLRDRDELLDAAWSDAPPELRPAAALTLAAHLEKLAEEGRLPPGGRAHQSRG